MRMRKLATISAAAAVVATTVLANAAPAAADGVTGATITSVTTLSGAPYPLYSYVTYDNYLSEYLPGQTLKVSGTSSSGASGDVTTLDLRCYYSDSSYDNVTQGITPKASGAWVAYVDPISREGDDPCVFRAVPHGEDPASLTPYPAFGTIYRIGYFEIDRLPADSSAGNGLDHYEFYSELAKSYPDQSDSSDCSDFGTYLHTSTTDLSAYGPYFWDCAGAVYSDYSATGPVVARAGTIVGGHPAYDPDSTASINGHGDGVEPMAVGLTQDPTTGDVVISEVSDLLYCIDSGGAIYDPLQPTSTNCVSWAPSGVRHTRLASLVNGGNTTVLRDTYSSTDGAAHAVSWTVDDEVNNSATPDWRFPGQTTFAPPTTSQVIDTTAWPQQGTVYTHYDSGTPDGTAALPVGAMTYSAKPSSAVAYGPYEVYSVYQRALAAGGSATVTRTYSVEASATAVTADAAAAESSTAPKLVLTPLPLTTGTHVAVVSGHFTGGGNGFPASVTANGIGAPVSADGTFSVTVPLSALPGLQTIAVSGVDPVGQVAAGSVSTTYANPVGTGTPKVSKTKRAGKVTKETVTVPVTCASYGPAVGCKITLKLGAKGKPVAPSRTVKVLPGRSAKVVLTLASSARGAINKLAAGKHLSGVLQTIYSDPAGGTLAGKRKTVKLA
ncbi:MAG TPA: hypothetical protein VHE83_06615 [Mycobacteriales bacterium]|nr:hypothetical protein [Mycobacteriales bacterium]